MNSKPLIELSAIAGKIAIDQTKLHPLAKEAIKWTIDQVREILKNYPQITYGFFTGETIEENSKTLRKKMSEEYLQCCRALWCI